MESSPGSYAKGRIELRVLSHEGGGGGAKLMPLGCLKTPMCWVLKGRVAQSCWVLMPSNSPRSTKTSTTPPP